MSVRRLLPLFLLFLAPALLAQGLDKYKSWPDSPQGAFMTSAERAEWNAKVKTDADAEEFVRNFVARHGADFAKAAAVKPSPDAVLPVPTLHQYALMIVGVMLVVAGWLALRR